MYHLSRVLLGAALSLMVSVPAHAQQSSSDQAAEDLSLAEIEPFYSRFGVLESCVRSAFAMAGGEPSQRARIASELCAGAANDFRALLGSRVGATRARAATELYFSKLAETLDASARAEQARRSPEELIAERAQWSSGHWHVIEINDQCILIHMYDGSTTFGGISIAGATPFDIVIARADGMTQIALTTPGRANMLAYYKDRVVPFVLVLSNRDSGRVQEVSANAAVSRSADGYFANFGEVSAWQILNDFDRIEIKAIEGDGTTPLAGYRFNIQGMQEAVSAFQRCS